jgi:hypothetical protein
MMSKGEIEEPVKTPEEYGQALLGMCPIGGGNMYQPGPPTAGEE